MKRPYIPAGCNQQGRLQTPAVWRRAQAAAAQAVAAHVIADDPLDGPPDAPTQPGPLTPLQAADAGIDWGNPHLLLAVVIVSVLALFALGGCTALPQGPDRDTTPPAVYASCPPLADMRRTDPDALRTRVAELESWYAQCRAAAMGVKR